MNNNLVMDAISYLDAELLAVHLEKKAELRARAKAKKKMILQWGAIAACIALILCMVPIVNIYILFDKADVNDSYIGGYEEQGLSEEINGVKVHYSNIFDGSNHAQAKFIYEGNLYVIDAISSGEIDLDYFLEKLLK